MTPAGRSPEQVFTVRYEDFVADTAGTLADAAAFCDIPWGDEYAHLVPQLSSRNDKWKRMMTVAEQVAMLREADAGLRHFGYLQGSNEQAGG